MVPSIFYTQNVHPARAPPPWPLPLTLLIGLDEEVGDSWVVLGNTDTEGITSLLGVTDYERLEGGERTHVGRDTSQSGHR